MNIEIKEKETIDEAYSKYLINELFCSDIENYILSLDEFEKYRYNK